MLNGTTPNRLLNGPRTCRPKKEVVLYCARGVSVSNSVLNTLLSGNIKARYIEGGIDGWKKKEGKSQKK
jgi:rhodanese-related sulfurtransferase